MIPSSSVAANVRRQRPSHKELSKKLALARQALKENRFSPASPMKLAANYRELDLYDALSQIEALGAALAEVTPDCYAGAYPPQRSYEETTRDQELYPFCWRSDHFRERMYIKFLLRAQENRPFLYLFSIHRDRKAS
jgi:hypothetical protein